MIFLGRIHEAISVFRGIGKPCFQSGFPVADNRIEIGMLVAVGLVWALVPQAQAGVFHRRDGCSPCFAPGAWRLLMA